MLREIEAIWDKWKYTFGDIFELSSHMGVEVGLKGRPVLAQGKALSILENGFQSRVYRTEVNGEGESWISKKTTNYTNDDYQ